MGPLMNAVQAETPCDYFFVFLQSFDLVLGTVERVTLFWHRIYISKTQRRYKLMSRTYASESLSSVSLERSLLYFTTVDGATCQARIYWHIPSMYSCYLNGIHLLDVEEGRM